MARTITRLADHTKVFYSLNYARRVRPVVASGCSTEGELALAVGEMYQRKLSAHRGRRDALTRLELKQFDQQFFANHCKSFIVYGDRPESGCEVPDKIAGFIILDGELMGLRSIHKGLGDWFMQHAIDNGAVLLQCWQEPYLIDFYTRHGFHITEVEPSNTNDPRQVVTMELCK